MVKFVARTLVVALIVSAALAFAGPSVASSGGIGLFQSNMTGSKAAVEPAADKLLVTAEGKVTKVEITDKQPQYSITTNGLELRLDLSSYDPAVLGDGEKRVRVNGSLSKAGSGDDQHLLLRVESFMIMTN